MCLATSRAVASETVDHSSIFGPSPSLLLKAPPSSTHPADEALRTASEEKLKMGRGTAKISLEHLVMAESKGVFKNMSRGYRRQFEGASTHQIWDNLSTKIIKDTDKI